MQKRRLHVADTVAAAVELSPPSSANAQLIDQQNSSLEGTVQL